MKTASYLALVTAICVVIFWVFMALRPANAQQGYRPHDDLRSGTGGTLSKVRP